MRVRFLTGGDPFMGMGGFTALELLATIGVVGILASFVVASLSAAKAKTLEAQCLHNLKQHGQALSMFVSEHNVYPLQINMKRKEGKYLDHAGTWMASLFPDRMEDFDLDGNKGVFDCPAARRPESFATPMGYADYGYNANGLIGRPGDNPLGLGGHGSEDDVFAPPVKEPEVLAPAEMLAIGDGLHGWNKFIQDGFSTAGRISSASDADGSTQRAMKRHKGKAVFTYCDAHAESVSLESLFNSTNPESLTLWNRDNKPHSERLQ